MEPWSSLKIRISNTKVFGDPTLKKKHARFQVSSKLWDHSHVLCCIGCSVHVHIVDPDLWRMFGIFPCCRQRSCWPPAHFVAKIFAVGRTCGCRRSSWYTKSCLTQYCDLRNVTASAVLSRGNWPGLVPPVGIHKMQNAICLEFWSFQSNHGKLSK